MIILEFLTVSFLSVYCTLLVVWSIKSDNIHVVRYGEIEFELVEKGLWDITLKLPKNFETLPIEIQQIYLSDFFYKWRSRLKVTYNNGGKY